jgi:hypothetical protein
VEPRLYVNWAYTRKMGSSRTETTNGNGDRRNEQATVSRFFFQRKVVLGVIVVVLAIGVLWTTSRAATSVVVPDLLGQRVDPQLDGVRLRLASAGLVLSDVTIKPCPTMDIAGTSLEELPGTIIDQHPAGGEKVAASSAVDVTVCLPDSAA